jgi:hypothetical protein
VKQAHLRDNRAQNLQESALINGVETSLDVELDKVELRPVDLSIGYTEAFISAPRTSLSPAHHVIVVP